MILRFIKFNRTTIVSVYFDLQKLNPLFEADKEEDLIAEVLSMFDPSRTEIKWHVQIVGNRLKLNLNSTDESIKFVFQTILCRSDNNIVSM